MSDPVPEGAHPWRTDTEVCAGFTLTGTDFDPGDVTSRIGLTPTRTWNSGDLKVPGATVRKKSSGWSFYTTREQTWDMNRHIAQIVDSLRPHIADINAVREEFSLDAYLACVLYIREERPALTFDRSTLEVIDALNAEIDVDIYLLPTHA